MCQGDTDIKLYHREVYWMDKIDKEAKEFVRFNSITLSKHFLDNLATSDYRPNHTINLNNLIHRILDLKKCDKIEPFEVEYSNNKLTKIVIRIRYNDNNDVSIVLREKGFLVTAWLNDKNDDHVTLDASKYANK